MTTARFSPDGRLVATAGSYPFTEPGTGRVKIWDWARGGRPQPDQYRRVLGGVRSQRFPDRCRRSDRTGGDLGCGERNAPVGARGEHGGHQRCRLQPRRIARRHRGRRRHCSAVRCEHGHTAAGSARASDAASRALPSARTARSLPPRARAMVFGSGPSTSTISSRSPGSRSGDRSPTRNAANTSTKRRVRRPERGHRVTETMHCYTKREPSGRSGV